MKHTVQPGGRVRQFLTGGFFLLVLVVAMAVFFAARQRIADTEARSILKATDQLSNVLSSARQAESGQRGYLLTGDPAYLGPYDIALQDLPGELQALDQSLGKTPDAGNLVVIRHIIESKLIEMAQIIALNQAGNHAGALALVENDSGMREMRQLRLLIASMKAELARKLAANEEQDNRNGWILQVATALAILGTVLLGSFAIRDARARNRQLRLAEAGLTEANEALERKVEARTRTLRASETQFRTLAESMLGLVFMSDKAGALTFVNAAIADYSGLPVAALLGDGWLQMVYPDDVPPTLRAWQHSVSTGNPFELEFMLRNRAGAYRWYLARAVPLRDENQNITGWIGTGTDIDDRKRAETETIDANVLLEEQVAERSRELDRIFNLSIDILTVTRQGEFLALSPAWERILGYKVVDTLGKNMADFVHPEDLARTQSVLSDVSNGQVVTGFENRFRRADGSYRWLSWRAVSLPEEGRGYSVARDVTVEKDREEQLRQSQKMEVIGQLTGGIAHDFNNLLTIIMGSLELLQRGLGKADAKIIRRIDAAMDGSRRAAALTHRLLAFARRQPLEPNAIEPDRLLAGMSDMLTRALGENIALEIVNAAGLWRVMADINQLENSILNLAVNARDAMADGGHLTIETQNVYLDDTYAADRTDVQPGQYVMIAVTDTGCGMAPEVRAKVFEPFFTTKPQGQGTGLGLAQVYGFIKQSSGHAAIYSEPGQGTSVKLYLPRLRGTLSPPAVEGLPQPADMQSRGETILVVEDEENVRNFSIEVLEDFGYQVLAAENAAEALLLLETAPTIDLLFTDVVLTGTMNGRILAEKIAGLRPGIKVLFTTGYTRNAIIHHGRLDSGIDFIGKPFTALALSQMVRKILDRNTVRRAPSLRIDDSIVR